MKKLLFFLLLLIPICGIGQEIQFMGLDFGTDMDVFCKRLESKGLKQVVNRFNKREFEGTFATYSGCRIIITATEISKKVMSAEVIFESVRNKEYERDKVYNEILEQYKSKYGQDRLFQSSKEDLLGMLVYKVLGKDVKITISKIGPSFLSPDECTMSIYYYSESLTSANEKAEKKHSDDI